MSCVIDPVSEFSYYEFTKTYIRKSKKTHTCNECNREISPGENYEYLVGKFDGKFYQQHTCMDCLSLRNTFFCSWYSERLWEDFSEYLEKWWYSDSDKLYKIENLTKRARNMVLEMIDKLESGQQLSP